MLPGGCRAVVSDRSHGDLRAALGEVATARRRALVDLPWTTPRQVHGRSVLVLAPVGAGPAGGGPAGGGPTGRREVDADAVVTSEVGQAIAVLGADCALVGLTSAEGVIAVAHAGWRGLLAGVLEATVDEMRGAGAGDISAVLGPCIHPECYAFGAGDLDEVAGRLGPSVRGRTSGGALALDVPAAVASALARAGVPAPVPLGGCTGCDPGYFSHRARRDEGRHALVLYRVAP